MVIGQDWATVKYFKEHKGLEEFITKNPTNENLRKLLSLIGFVIERPKGYETTGKIFLTNAILCLKDDDGKGLQSSVNKEWFNNCGNKFLKPLIECLNPNIIVTLGILARDCVLDVFNIHKSEFRGSMIKSIKSSPNGIKLNQQTLLFPVYHCGAGITNRTRTFEKQLEDWSRIK
jgi:uracil-DNA glycosylase